MILSSALDFVLRPLTNMKKRLPPLNWLHSFDVAARHLNFTLAATELNLTQAAVSQQIRGLESQLGCTLFKRLPRGLELTDSGLAYLPVIRDSIARMSAATDEIFGQVRHRPLTLKVSLVFYTCWLVFRLARFREAHPNISLRFTSNIWVNEIDQKDADMEIRYGHGDWQGMICERLTWDRLIPVCAPKLRSLQRPPVSVEELSQCTLLHVLGYEEGWGHWLNKTGYGHVEAASNIQFDTLISALETAAQGEGIALGRSSLVEGMLSSGKLISPFEHSIETSEAFYLARPIKQIPHPNAEAFRQWILQEIGTSHAQLTG